MKVWLCSDGSYSDYGPTAIYSDEETAKRMTEAYGWDNAPEEYDLDPEVPSEARQGFSYYCVRMWDNGDTQRVYKTQKSEYTSADRWEENKSWPWSPREGWMLITYCWASDEAHAVKIANERRIQRLANTSTCSETEKT